MTLTIIMTLTRATLACLLAAACRVAPPLRLGTTTTVQASGALAVVESLWAARHRLPLATVIAPSGQTLHAAANGDVDVVITHAPTLEDRILVTPGHAELRCPFVASRFAIVGLAADPAGVGRATSAADALRRIARAGSSFVSRADSSGTNAKELALWRTAGVSPARPWYIESGVDQATTLHIANERDAYALADLPTLAKLTDLQLRVLFVADTALTNPYTLYVARETPRGPAAREFAAWAIDTARAAILAIRLPDGTPAFVPRQGGCATPSAGQ